MFHCYNWQTFKLFCMTFVFFVVFDIVWIMANMNNSFKELISFLNLSIDPTFNTIILAGIIIWALIVKGIIMFVLPATHGSYACALYKGGIYGLILYGVYQFTNFAILDNWPINLSDIFWGVAVCSIATVFALYLAHRFNYHSTCEISEKGKRTCL